MKNLLFIVIGMVGLVTSTMAWTNPDTGKEESNPNVVVYENTKYVQTRNDFLWYLAYDGVCSKMAPRNINLIMSKLDNDEAQIVGKPIYRPEGTIHILWIGDGKLPKHNMYFASTKEACLYLEEKARDPKFKK